MSDVAREAGVSRQLVSLVIRGVGYVSEEKRELVVAAADRLGYRRNTLAAHLAARRTHSIGMPIYDFRNQVYADFVSGIQAVLEPRGYRLLVTAGSPNSEAAAEAVESLVGLRPDGLILATYLLDDGSRLRRALDGVSAVTLGEPIDLDGVDSVRSDGHRGTAEATEHLLDTGHRRIVYLEGRDSPQNSTRRAGYEEAMRRAGLSPLTAPGDATREGAASAARGLLGGIDRTSSPSGIVCYNDASALGVLDIAQDLQLDVPGDLAVVGYDNSEPASYPGINLTSVDQQAREMGVRAASLLLDRIETGRPEALQEVLRPELVVRASSGR